jgi:protein-disulfide isomerase
MTKKMKNQKEIIPVIPPKDIVIGDPAAPVTLMEFGDYESEACARVNETVKALLETHAGKLNFIFRHFPLTRIHQKAHKAAEAAIGAAQEGKFWEMHQELFANRRNLGVISLKSYAKEIGATNKRFLDDLINGVYGWHVQGDLMEGIQMGVRDVPAFFVNGKRVDEEMKNPVLKT